MARVHWALTVKLSLAVGFMSAGFASTAAALDVNQLIRGFQLNAAPSPRDDVDPELRELQRMLSDLGYDVGPADGRLTSRTERSIALFQRRSNLQVDGLPGPRTRAAVRAAWSQRQVPAGLATPLSPDERPVVSGPSFDCRKVKGASELAVCGNAELSDLDREMARLFDQSGKLARSEDDRARRRAEQIRFFRERNACGSNAACIQRLYVSRIEDLTSKGRVSGGVVATAPDPGSAPPSPSAVTGTSRVYTVYSEQATYPFRQQSNRGQAQTREQAKLAEIAAGHAAFRRAIDFAIAAQFPEVITEDENVAFFWMLANLSARERSAVEAAAGVALPSKSFELSRLTEFDRAALRDAFRQISASSFAASAPQLPAEIHEIRHVHLEQYDFSAGGFPIRIGPGEGVPRLTMPAWDRSLTSPWGALASVASDMGIRGWPSRLIVPRDVAETLISRAQNRNIFAKTTLVWRGVQRTAQGSSVRLSLDIEAMAIDFYSDALLTDRISTIDLAPLRTAPPAQADPTSSMISRIEPAHPDAIAALIAEMSGDASFVDRIIDFSSQVRRESEFRRAEIAATLKSSFPKPVRGEFWLPANVALGEYNFSAQGFAVRELLFIPSRGQSGLSTNHLEIRPARSGGIGTIAADAAKAEAALKAAGMGSERNFEAFVRVQPARAEMVQRSHVGIAGRLYVELREVVVFSRRNAATGPILIAHGEPRSEQKISSPVSVVAPEKLVLDFEALDLLLLRADPSRMDAMLARMFLERWALEAAEIEPVWGRFFNRNQPLPTVVERAVALSRFRDWTQRRIAALPSTFVVRSGQRSYAGLSGCSPVPIDGRILFRETPDFAHLVVRPKPGETLATLQEQGTIVSAAANAHALESAHIAILDRPLFKCVGSSIEGLRQEYAIPPQKKAAAMVVLANALLPAGSVYSQSSASVYEVTIERVEIIGSSPTPDMQLFARVLRAEHMASRDGAVSVISRLTPSDVGKSEQSKVQAQDVSGLRLGMSFDEADRIVRAHMPVGRMLEAERTIPDSGRQNEPFRAGRLYVRDDSMEFFVLFHEPPAASDRVLGILRWSILPQGEIHADNFMDALVAKYGPPSSRSFSSEAYWMSPTAAAFRHRCLPVGHVPDLAWTEAGSLSDWRSPDVPDGPAYRHPNPAARRNLPLPVFNPGNAEGATPQCGIVTAAAFRTTGPARPGMGSMRGTAELTVMLLDVGTAMQHLESGLNFAKTRKGPSPAASPAQSEGKALKDRLKL